MFRSPESSLKPVVNTKLSVSIVDMRLHGAWADLEVFSDLLVAFARADL